eukprot:300603_1
MLRYTILRRAFYLIVLLLCLKSHKTLGTEVAKPKRLHLKTQVALPVDTRTLNSVLFCNANLPEEEITREDAHKVYLFCNPPSGKVQFIFSRTEQPFLSKTPPCSVKFGDTNLKLEVVDDWTLQTEHIQLASNSCDYITVTNTSTFWSPEVFSGSLRINCEEPRTVTKLFERFWRGGPDFLSIMDEMLSYQFMHLTDIQDKDYVFVQSLRLKCYTRVTDMIQTFRERSYDPAGPESLMKAFHTFSKFMPDKLKPEKPFTFDREGMDIMISRGDDEIFWSLFIGLEQYRHLFNEFPTQDEIIEAVLTTAKRDSGFLYKFEKHFNFLISPLFGDKKREQHIRSLRELLFNSRDVDGEKCLAIIVNYEHKSKIKELNERYGKLSEKYQQDIQEKQKQLDILIDQSKSQRGQKVKAQQLVHTQEKDNHERQITELEENHRQVSGTLHKDLEEKNKLVRVLEEQSKAQQLVHTQEKDNHERQIIHTQEKDNHERQITELEENHRQVSGTLHKDLEEKNKLVRVLEEQSKAQQLVHTQEKGKLKSTNLELVEENTTLANKHDKITKDQKELEKKMKVDAIRMSKLRIGKERHVEYLKDRLEELRLKT